MVGEVSTKAVDTIRLSESVRAAEDVIGLGLSKSVRIRSLLTVARALVDMRGMLMKEDYEGISKR